MSTWPKPQPIETAPRGWQNRIMLWDGLSWTFDYILEAVPYGVTHWLPLPPKPEQA